MVLAGNQFVYDGTRQRFVSLPMLFLLGVLILTACPGVDIEDPTPPSKPEWVQKSLPEEWPERGIDAHESNGIYLEWEPSFDEDIVAYTIYRAVWYPARDSLGEYSLLTRLETNSYPDPNYIDGRVDVNVTYYYTIEAEDASGNTSELSDPAFYKLLLQIKNEYMTPSGQTTPLDENRALSWFAISQIDLEDYCLTLLSQENELLARIVLQPKNYTGLKESWYIPDTVVLKSGNIYKWRIDVGAKYVAGRETVGSESPWALFLFES